MSIAGVRVALEGNLSGTLRADEPLARHTSYGIGGPAALFVEADTIGDLKLALTTCREHDVASVVLGKGSNMLVSDEGYDGVVVVLGRDFKHHCVEGERITSGAGVILAHVVQDAYARGLSGLEFAVGVPGTIGGAVVMNAGTRNDWMGSIVESVTVFDPLLGLVGLRSGDVNWGYRVTDIADKGIAVECVLRLREGDKTSIRRTMDASLTRRKKSQPLAVRTAGSVFRNPEGDSAGRLIESVGLKGARYGGAEISTVHANFIVNRKGATAADVVALVRRARSAVKDRYGIELKPEIRFLGSFFEA